MARTAPNDKPKRPPLPTAATEKARTNQLVSLARDVSEERLRNGTASAQEIVFWLREGSEQQQLVNERTITQTEKDRAQISAIQQAEDIELLMKDALQAFAGYSGQADEDYYDQEL